jgi:hypothetical protein
MSILVHRRAVTLAAAAAVVAAGIGTASAQ